MSSPRLDDRAVLVPLLNPTAFVAGEPAHFGEAILAGPSTGDGPFRLFDWDQPLRDVVPPKNSSAEALFTSPRGIHILFDRGDDDSGGKKCKKSAVDKRGFVEQIF